MRASKIVLTVLAVIIGVVLLGGGCGGCYVYQSYKMTIRLDEEAQKTWADVEVVLKRRFDLIPNIVQTVKGYAKHEKELLQGIADVRKSYFGANTMGEKAKAAGALEGMLSRLLVLRETYPELKANENFRALQIELEGTENRITEMRKRYNDAVRALNTHIRGPVGSIVAGWAGVEKGEYFQAGEEAQQVPKVEF
ncbi:MAG: LemA family protein [Phycisphaerae bacterium]|nr:LemA family protein [Phycisphaerae bacterium]